MSNAERIGSRARFDATTLEALKVQLNAAFGAVGSGAATQAGLRFDLRSSIPTAAPEAQGSPNVVMANAGSNVMKFYWWSGTAWVTPSLSDHTHAFADLTAKPTTLAGYGITDAASDAELANYLPLAGGTLSGDLAVSGTTFTFSANTADGSDTAKLSLNGGGVPESGARGGIVAVHGNEHASFPGNLHLFAGTLGSIRSRGDVLFDTDNTYDLGKSGATRPRNVFVAGILHAGTHIQVAGSQIIGTRKTGWGSATGTLSRASFDTGTISTATAAQVLGALITDLRAHGIIGT